MSIKFSGLQCKEVICLSDGRRLGFVSDVQIQMPEGTVRAIVVPAPGKCFGLLGHREDYLISWDCIRKIGPDIVLVDVNPADCRVPRPKQNLFG